MTINEKEPINRSSASPEADNKERLLVGSLESNSNISDGSEGELVDDGLSNHYDNSEIYYDPEKIRSVSAEQADDIYDRAHQLMESGASDEEVQSVINEGLRALSIDLDTVVDGMVPVEMIYRDGNSSIRLMVVRAEDFGTAVRGKKLVASESVSQVVEPIDDKFKVEEPNILAEESDNNPALDIVKDTAESMQQKESLVEEYRTFASEKLDALERQFSENAEQHRKARQVMNEFISKLSSLTNSGDVFLPGAAKVLYMEFEGLTQAIYREKVDASEEIRQFNSMGSAMGRAYEDLRGEFDEGDRETVDASWRRMNSLLEGMNKDRKLVSAHTENVFKVIEVLARVLNQLSYDSRGRDAYEADLRRAVAGYSNESEHRDAQARAFDEHLQMLRTAIAEYRYQ